MPGHVRRSTVGLTAGFTLALVLYFLVRPATPQARYSPVIPAPAAPARPTRAPATTERRYPGPIQPPTSVATSLLATTSTGPPTTTTTVPAGSPGGSSAAGVPGPTAPTTP